MNDYGFDWEDDESFDAGQAERIAQNIKMIGRYGYFNRELGVLEVNVDADFCEPFFAWLDTPEGLFAQYEAENSR